MRQSHGYKLEWSYLRGTGIPSSNCETQVFFMQFFRSLFVETNIKPFVDKCKVTYQNVDK